LAIHDLQLKKAKHLFKCKIGYAQIYDIILFYLDFSLAKVDCAVTLVPHNHNKTTVMSISFLIIGEYVQLDEKITR
jgi:hypothetical protein